MSRDGDNHFQAYQQQSTPTSNGDVTRMPEPSYDATRVNTLKFEPTIANQQQPPTSFPIAQIHRTHTEPVMEMPNPSYMSSVLTNAPSSSLVHHLPAPAAASTPLSSRVHMQNTERVSKSKSSEMRLTCRLSNRIMERMCSSLAATIRMIALAPANK
ncbi:hypothetical protein B0F90DRAFT_839480 [Multifurca ochricompacta]|uniref:Uncharacterized protein n=1 Tax=Multifurca ochricompacta TaxID=376703 RepID=A0AAD4M0U5_9AGAM|nr:hypothetical protein B0F90DRAFT_839480 [Multifurca ochricompacta]